MLRRHLVPLVAATLLTTLATPAPALADPAPVEPWTADLTAVDGDDVGVAAGGGVLRLAPGAHEGYLLLAPRALAGPVGAVAAEVDGSAPEGTTVEVDVRVAAGDGQWGEWLPAGAPLPAGTRTTQVRVALTAAAGAGSAAAAGAGGAGGPTAAAGPEVRSVRLVPDPAPDPATSRAAAPDDARGVVNGTTYRVFATREGLVGGTTANGHVITERDHFVALPSRRGLSPKGTGSYTVQVCAGNGRCEWAPVWDVGPWNTKDDYWNPPATRESWKDLPQGVPQAQAAYLNGYNGGKDQFDRRVLNPAGIDLADGVFWDGLKLSDNDWVTVTYLWTASGLTGYVRTGGDGPLNVRGAASATAPQVGIAADYAQVRVLCQLRGQSVSGPEGTSNLWYRIATGKYVARAYVTGVVGAKLC
ncbi:hypothetical protein [Actinosynnema mirum]|uniref:Secreted protein n=1 Tax=Actinosynnema mirum (strain ATCC 29888 / DSM 43827 / JCM 3225 / NBRC 14064 / NCIMB 13271 / NRRL B-12336 / IMRU 3971 / 101) TaxID=446462 RepID=C6WND2_ACTMD|nr:hypothetical protein [Actinosynnema mirum]ACU40496.1 hypothetical protein Amir_6699 [Actinosynnema mirum DSM 43827]